MSNDVVVQDNTDISTLPTNSQMAAFVARLNLPESNKISVGNKKFEFPNGEKVDSFKGIIVEFRAVNAYFASAYKSNAIAPPDCIAIGEFPKNMKPLDVSPMKQHDTCQGCWANEFGSHPVSNGKACGNRRQLAILVPSENLQETPTIMYLRISSTALRPFDEFLASQFAKTGLMPNEYVTTFAFEPTVKYDSVRFSTDGVRVIGDALTFIASKRQEAVDYLETPPDYAAYAEAQAAAAEGSQAARKSKLPEKK